uniref:F-box protein n=1 Tax=Solanum tuberosum TaxID=4113 RepID=M1DP41_SOLTU
MRNVDGVAICNPSTKVVRSLPRLKECPKIDYAEYFCSMGFDPEEKTYKVLMTINGFTKPTRNWVFTLGRDEESWREIKGITDFVGKNAVCVSGVIYILSYSMPNIFVLGFDVKSENFRIITLWNSLDEHIGGSYYNILKVNGKLAILDKKIWYMEGNFDLWILGKEEWEKHMIEIPAASPEFKRLTFCGTCDGEILFTNKLASESDGDLDLSLFAIFWCLVAGPLARSWEESAWAPRSRDEWSHSSVKSAPRSWRCSRVRDPEWPTRPCLQHLVRVHSTWSIFRNLCHFSSSTIFHSVGSLGEEIF